MTLKREEKIQTREKQTLGNGANRLKLQLNCLQFVKTLAKSYTYISPGVLFHVHITSMTSMLLYNLKKD